jgi:hypothetical protein
MITIGPWRQNSLKTRDFRNQRHEFYADIESYTKTLSLINS